MTYLSMALPYRDDLDLLGARPVLARLIKPSSQQAMLAGTGQPGQIMVTISSRTQPHG